MQSQAEQYFVANWREAAAAVLRYSALASSDMIGAKPSLFLQTFLYGRNIPTKPPQDAQKITSGTLSRMIISSDRWTGLYTGTSFVGNYGHSNRLQEVWTTAWHTFTSVKLQGSHTPHSPMLHVRAGRRICSDQYSCSGICLGQGEWGSDGLPNAIPAKPGCLNLVIKSRAHEKEFTQ